MYGLVRFGDNSYGIYNKKNFTAVQNEFCIVKHNGSKYEANIIAWDKEKANLKLIKEQEIKKNCQPVAELSSEDSFKDVSFGIDYVHINRSSNSLINDFNESVFEDVSENQNHTHTRQCSGYKTSEFEIAELSETSTQEEFDSNRILEDVEPPEDKKPSEFKDNSYDDPNYELSASSDSSQLSADSDLSHCENENDNVLGNISNRKSVLSKIQLQLSASITEPGSCDDSDMLVTQSRGRKGDRKANFCFYCHTKQQKIARHLENKHRDEEEVKKFTLLPKGLTERKEIIGKIRKQGNFLFNTDQNFNDGELIVSRRPKNVANKTAKDFRACANCKAFFSKQTLRVHFNSCTGLSNKSHRVATLLSKKIAGRIHAKASHTVKNYLFPPLRDDNVSRIIRYDELIIIFANKMVEKYRERRHFQMIRQRLRLLGKFLINVKEINNKISNLTSIYDPSFVDDVLVAINMSAGYTESTNIFQAPTVAFTLGTLLKQIGNILITQSIKNQNDSIKKHTKDFLKIFIQEVNINVNRTVAETQLNIQRRKSIMLPSMEDIKKLRDYLSSERKKALNDFKEKISRNTWLKLAELTLTSIQLFNRRRAGEVERILIGDFETYQTVEQSNGDLFKTLSETSKEIAKKYIRFTIRGKLNRTVPVLLDTDLLKCVKLIIKHRTEVGVLDNNPYVFGVPSDNKKQDSHLQACHLMRKFSDACGAEHPNRLRGTNLRKHIATTCVNLNLQDQEITDLSNFMGHSANIHKGIYRQPIVSREILGISKLLEAAQGITVEDNSNDNSDDEIEISENRKSMPSASSNNFTPAMKKRTTITNVGSAKKVRWNEDEKNAIYRIFKENLRNRVLPSLKAIQLAIKETPALQNRTSPQIKTWIHNQLKSTKKKLSFSN